MLAAVFHFTAYVRFQLNKHTLVACIFKFDLTTGEKDVRRNKMPLGADRMGILTLMCITNAYTSN